MNAEKLEHLWDNLNKKRESFNKIERENLSSTGINEKFETQPINNNFEEEKKNDEVEIENIKKEIEVMDIEINKLLNYFNPYLNIPKVNEQITKVKEKLNEVDTSEIIDSLTDYIRVKDIKTNVLNYLHKAQDYIMSKSNENQTIKKM